MNIEIERKYLVKDDRWKDGLTEADSSFIQQAYLSVFPGPTVRIRIKDSNAWLTVKGEPSGIRRQEYEYKIPQKEALEMIKMAPGGEVIKRRYEINYQGKTWELDEFLGANEGLVLAEIELDNENESFEIPEWIGEDVSLDPAYKNSALAEKPYKSW